MQARIFLVMLTTALITIGTPIVGMVGAEVVPPPGHLLVLNQLAAASSGDCEGSVTLMYGIMVEQRQRQWSAVADAFCNVQVMQRSDQGAPIWRPVGWVAVSAGASVLVKGDYGEDGQTVWLTQWYNYPTLPCTFDPIKYGSVDFWQQWPTAPLWDRLGHQTFGDDCERHSATTWAKCASASPYCGSVYTDAQATVTHTTCQITPGANLEEFAPFCEPGDPDYHLPHFTPPVSIGTVSAGGSGSFPVGHGK